MSLFRFEWMTNVLILLVDVRILVQTVLRAAPWVFVFAVCHKTKTYETRGLILVMEVMEKGASDYVIIIKKENNRVHCCSFQSYMRSYILLLLCNVLYYSCIILLLY